MTAEMVEERLNQFRRRMWSFEEIKVWFGIDIEGEAAPMLVPFGFWGGAYEDGFRVIEGNFIYRNYLERFLQERELVPIRFAALRWGLDVETFRNTLRRAVERGLIAPSEAVGVFPSVFSASFIADFYKRFPRIARLTFSTYSSFIRLLHREITGVLEMPVRPLLCQTSLALRDDPPEVGNSFDCITGEPIGLGYQIWLDTPKPIQLALDRCSWRTMAEYYEQLSPAVLGSLDDFEQRREELSNVIRQ